MALSKIKILEKNIDDCHKCEQEYSLLCEAQKLKIADLQSQLKALETSRHQTFLGLLDYL